MRHNYTNRERKSDGKNVLDLLRMDTSRETFQLDKLELIIKLLKRCTKAERITGGWELKKAHRQDFFQRGGK